MLIKILILTVALTLIGSRWIDYLYRMPDAPLSFPEEVAKRSRFREPLLAILIFAGISQVTSAQSPLSIYLVAAIFLLALITFTDFEQYVIFDRMLMPFALIGIVALVHLNLPVLDRLIAALVGGGIFLLMATLTHGGIGGGDIKLVAVLGIWLGTDKLLDVVIISCVMAGVVALVLILTKLKDRKSYFAYGPYFALTTIYILANEPLI